MKLVRYGPAGREKPGLLDAQGTVRDLSSHVGDLAPDLASLARLAALDPRALPAVEKVERLGPCVAGIRNILGVGLNYHSILAEAGQPAPDEPVMVHEVA